MRLRPTHKLFAILFFYVFLAVMVVVFSATAGMFTYRHYCGIHYFHFNVQHENTH